jgi:hypothetical protein
MTAVPNNWHSDTIERFKTLTTDSLIHIRKDAYEAAKAGDGWNPKAGQYWDEYHYACMELHKRDIMGKEPSRS